MLSLLPQIMFLAPAGTTLLRLAAAFCFGYMAWYFWQKKDALQAVAIPIIGHMRYWMILVSIAVTALSALLLLLGARTQVVAIVGTLICLKHLFYFRRYRDILPFERSTYWLLLCICLMLVVTGAGAFAFDLPL